MFIQILKDKTYYQLIGDNDEILGMLTPKQVENLLYEDVEIEPLPIGLTLKQGLIERRRAIENSIL